MSVWFYKLGLTKIFTYITGQSVLCSNLLINSLPGLGGGGPGLGGGGLAGGSSSTIAVIVISESLVPSS